MCRICGRMVKCIFDNMPSRAPSIRTTQTFRSISCNTAIASRSSSTLSKTASSKTATLPLRAHLSTATAQLASLDHSSSTDALPPSMLSQHIPSQPSSLPTSVSTSLQEQYPPPTLTKPLVLSKSLQQLLPNLTSQTPHYVQTHIHRFPYLLTTGDTLRLPFVLKGVSPGDTLRFNRASILGSRDYTLKAGTSSHTETYDRKRTAEPNYIDERLFECRMRVMGVESGPMMIKEKTKRRNRKVKTVRSKHRYTVLRCVGVRVRPLEELQNDPELQIVLE